MTILSLKTVLLIGSAPDAMRARSFDTTNVQSIVALNNAWRVRDDWNYLVHPEDFPQERRPIPGAGQQLIDAKTYVPANNIYGGIIYAGATMAFSAAYWVLDALQPDLLLFSGCDMIYDRKLGSTHFYGAGTADPLRQDPTLQSLEAKATRLMLLAAQKGCVCANISARIDSRLTFPRITAATLGADLTEQHSNALNALKMRHNETKVADVLKAEAELGYYVPSGDYWNSDLKIDKSALFDIDMQWRRTAHSYEHIARMSA